MEGYCRREEREEFLQSSLTDVVSRILSMMEQPSMESAAEGTFNALLSLPRKTPREDNTLSDPSMTSMLLSVLDRLFLFFVEIFRLHSSRDTRPFL